MLDYRYVLYRVFNADNELLYVGATTNPGLRFQDHARKSWWLEAAHITLERFAEWEDLNDAEREAITYEGPKHNVMHSKPMPWNHKPRRARGEGSFFQRSADGMWVGRIRTRGRQREVTAKDRMTALRKFEELKRQLAMQDGNQ